MVCYRKRTWHSLLLEISLTSEKVGPSTKKHWHCTERRTELHKTKGAYRDVHSTNFSRGFSPIKVEANAAAAKPNITSRTGCALSTVVLLCTCRERFLPLSRKENISKTRRYQEIRTVIGTVRSSKEANVHIQDLDTPVHTREVGGRCSLL